MISVARTTVERRWAMTTVLRPAIRASRAACTAASFVESSAEVASSSSSSLGSFASARAIATRCFCPPLTRTPFSPGRLSYPSGSSSMKACAFTLRAACTTSPREVSGRPYAMFSAIDRSKSTGSCSTSPICRRSHLSSRSA
mmetsp:Transcript_40692/g.92288  ORF Transcript_40692/g.92288 Transcript_40692/m.92288 type:complete len:142 (+) Transcript_40692:485-910(+)